MSARPSAWLAGAVALTIATRANADDSPQHDVRAAMHEYFAGEIRGGWTLTGMGLVGIGTGAGLIAAGDGAVRGAGYPILGFGIAHLAAGVFIQVTSRVRRRVFDVAIDRAPDAWARVEAARMRGVSKQFLALKIAWVALAAGGIAMAVIARREDRPTLEGVGYGLAIDAGATLVFDIFAARRAHRYRSAL